MDQGGVSAVVLYENVGIRGTFDSSGNVINVATSGQQITLDTCLRPYYTDAQQIGANFTLLHFHTISFMAFGLSSGLEKHILLNNVFGWYAVITFNNGLSYFINAPFFLKEESDLNSTFGHAWEVQLVNERETPNGLIPFIQGSVPIWILEEGTWNDAGVWDDLNIWIDN